MSEHDANARPGAHHDVDPGAKTFTATATATTPRHAAPAGRCSPLGHACAA